MMMMINLVLAIVSLVLLFIMITPALVYATANGAIMDGKPRVDLYTNEDFSVSMHVRINETEFQIHPETIPHFANEIQKLTVQLEQMIVTLERLNSVIDSMQPEELMMFNEQLKSS